VIEQKELTSGYYPKFVSGFLPEVKFLSNISLELRVNSSNQSTFLKLMVNTVETLTS